VRSLLALASLCLLSPGVGLTDDLSGTLHTAGRQLDGFQQWTAQRHQEENIRFENQKQDAQRTFDRIQEDIRLRRIEQRIDQLEQSRGAR
jgi:hypothetical protein